MIETIENSRTEFKVKLVDELEESVGSDKNGKWVVINRKEKNE